MKDDNHTGDSLDVEEVRYHYAPERKPKKASVIADIRALYDLLPPDQDPLLLALAIRARIEMNESDGQIFARDGKSARQWLQGVSRIGAKSTFELRWTKLVSMGLLQEQKRYSARSRLASGWHFGVQLLRGAYYRPAGLSANPAAPGLANTGAPGLASKDTAIRVTAKDSELRPASLRWPNFHGALFTTEDWPSSSFYYFW